MDKTLLILLTILALLISISMTAIIIKNSNNIQNNNLIKIDTDYIIINHIVSYRYFNNYLTIWMDSKCTWKNGRAVTRFEFLIRDKQKVNKILNELRRKFK